MPHVTDDEIIGWRETDQVQREEISRLRADMEVAIKRIAILESVLHKIADHGPPKGEEPVAWMKAMAAWALHPDLHPKPDQGTF